MAPGDYLIDRITVDPRVGGRIRIWHSSNGQSSGGFEGEFLKIVPCEELVYRWASVGTEPEKGKYYDSLVRVTLRPAPGGWTRMTIVHEKLDDLRRRAPQIFSHLDWGWDSCLDKLGAALGEDMDAIGP